MTEQEIKKLIDVNETQITEFKKSTAEKEQICGTICAFANSDGGTILVGIKPDRTLSKVSFSDESQTDITNLFIHFDPDLKRLVSINKTKFQDHFLLIIEVQKSNIKHHCYKGKCYKRVGASNQILSNEEWFEMRKNHHQEDWSAKICGNLNFEDLDAEAVSLLREKLVLAKGNNEYKTLEIQNLLNRVNLLTEGKINNTCALFLGKPEVTDKYLFDKNKISWVYRDEKNDLEERLSLDEIKKPFILLLPEIERQIQRKNTYLKDLDLFREDIWQYDESAVEEVLVNAIAHRNWEIPLWVEVVQTPISLEIRNPGNFDADWDKVLKFNEKPPYKNRNLVTFLNHIKLMEREGNGLRKVYKTQVSKGLEVIQRSVVSDRVDLILTGKVKNVEFAKFILARRDDIEVKELRILEKIAKGENKLERDISIQDYNRIKEFIKLHGPSKTLKFKSSIQKTSSEQVLKSASMKTLEQHILDHARDKKDIKGNYLEFYNSEIYDKLKSNKSTIRSILVKLVQKSNLIKVQDGCYKFNNSFKTITTANNGKNNSNNDTKN
jgi:ATP-dependent DNA helicase RecG